MINALFSPDSNQVLKVTELTQCIKLQLEREFTRIWVQGEISNLRQQSSGHVYFSLKDAESQLPCVLFARDAMQQGLEMADGMSVLLFGSLSVYEPHGRYQLIAKVVLQSGLGHLQIEYEQLKRKLAEEGLFEKEKKKPLPQVPTRIAVITSPSGAAIRDFLRILQRRNYKGEITILPARVQGKEAAKEISQMLEYAEASKDLDLVVITRGGGSIEDLWAFNEETLVRSIAACSLPVISAVGHEIDTVLTDFAADQRAETPSAAAELISSLVLNATQQLNEAQKKLLDCVQTKLSGKQMSLNKLQTRLQLIAPHRQIQLLNMKLDDLENRLGYTLQTRLNYEQKKLTHALQRLSRHHPYNRIQLAHQTLKSFDHSLKRAIVVAIQAKNEHLLHLQKRLENSSLQATLQRGYSVLKSHNGTIIDSASKGRNGDYLTAHLKDGKLLLKVND